MSGRKSKTNTRRWKIKIDDNGRLTIPSYKRPLKPDEAIVFAKTIMVSANEAQRKIARKNILSSLSTHETPTNDEYVSAVYELLKKIPAQDHSIENVAAKLDMSMRTLQRRLNEGGFSFMKIRDSVRLQLALDYLIHSDLPMDEIAELVGYGDRMGLRNACIRWTGISPLEFRKRFDGFT